MKRVEGWWPKTQCIITYIKAWITIQYRLCQIYYRKLFLQHAPDTQCHHGLSQAINNEEVIIIICFWISSSILDIMIFLLWYFQFPSDKNKQSIQLISEVNIFLPLQRNFDKAYSSVHVCLSKIIYHAHMTELTQTNPHAIWNIQLIKWKRLSWH